jgi:hypothetical protein
MNPHPRSIPEGGATPTHLLWLTQGADRRILPAEPRGWSWRAESSLIVTAE